MHENRHAVREIAHAADADGGIRGTFSGPRFDPDPTATVFGDERDDRTKFEIIPFPPEAEEAIPALFAERKQQKFNDLAGERRALIDRLADPAVILRALAAIFQTPEMMGNAPQEFIDLINELGTGEAALNLRETALDGATTIAEVEGI